MSTDTLKRTEYFDYLRIIATAAVMILHISALNYLAVDISTSEWNVFNIYDSFVRWSVPVFVMISGALFLEGHQSAAHIYRKNILRIVTAFLFWSAIYTAYGCTREWGLHTVLIEFIKGNYHMWFLYMIIGLYMIVPILRKIVESEKLTSYYLILALIFSVLCPFIINILSFTVPEGASLMRDVLNKMNFRIAVGYSGYFVLGYYLNKSRICRKAEAIIYSLGILGFLGTAALTVFASNYSGSANTIFYDYFSLTVLFESIAVFVFGKKHLSGLNLSFKAKMLLVNISKYSFGAYLVHAMVITVLDQHFGLDTLTFNPVISVPVIGLIVFVISFAISAVINRIPVLKKYIV